MSQGEIDGCAVCTHPAALLLPLSSWVSTQLYVGHGEHALFVSTPFPFTLRVNTVRNLKLIALVQQAPGYYAVKGGFVDLHRLHQGNSSDLTIVINKVK